MERFIQDVTRRNRKLPNSTDSSLTASRLSETGELSYQGGLVQCDGTKDIDSSPEIGISDILASCLQNLSPANTQDLEDIDEHILQVYNERTCLLLDRNQYTMENVMTWSWILMSQSSNEAIQKLTLLDADCAPLRIPFFLTNFILKQRSISSQSLHFLVEKFKATLLSNNEEADSTQMQFVLRPEDSSSTMLLFVRLLRHARKTWVKGFSDIADIFALMLPARPLQLQWQSDLDVKRYHLLAFYYNRALVLLSRPTHSNPYQHVVVQQQALLRILRTMTKFRPHIPVQREGFRALLSVQLAHKKTKLEKEWANLKALSWPPWKEEKSGLDADRGDIGSESRALGVIRQIREAGYSTREVEQIAAIYAGWDTDGSPTIQTRSFISIAQMRETSNTNRTLDASKGAHANVLWAARIATTRTLREAWSAFLNFEKEVSDHRLAPYFEMFAKLLFSRSNSSGRSTTVLAGDCKETFPEPLSPRHLTYVASELPTPGDLFERMTRRGLKPQGRLLSLLVAHSESLAEAMKYLNIAYPALVDHPARSAGNRSEQTFWACIRSLPLPILTAYLKALARFPAEFMHSINSKSIGESWPYVSPYFLAYIQRRLGPSRYDQRILIHYLFLILTRCNHASAAVWHPLLTAFKNVFLFNLRGRNAGYALSSDAWEYLDLIQRSMKSAGICLTLRDFNELCVIWEAFGLSGMCTKESSAYGSTSSSRFYFEKPHRLKFQCKAIFERLTMPFGTLIFRSQLKKYENWEQSVAPKDNNRPVLLVTPSYHTLHLLIQVLGAWNDESGLMSLLRWMRDYVSDLDRGAFETNNGLRQRRLAIVALRVYLERLWDTENTLSKAKNPNDVEQTFDRTEVSRPGNRFRVAEWAKHQTTATRLTWAKNIVSGVNSWGGWPNDEEVWRYLDGQSKFGSLRVKYASIGQRFD